MDAEILAQKRDIATT